MKTKHKTLIIFSPAFPANETDSSWLPWLHTLVTAFNKNYVELRVIVFAFLYPHTTSVYKWNNNTIIPFNGMHKKKAARFKMWVDIFFEVRKLRRQHDIIGILSIWCNECTFVARYVAKLFRLKYFCWIVGQDARKTNTYVKYIRPKASSLVTMSDFLVDEFYRSHGIKPRHTVPNGIDVSLFKAMPANKDIDIIGVGSLSFLKQYDLFVEITAALKNHRPGIKAMLCGDGEDRENIERLIKEFSLNETLTITGYIKHAEGLQMMQRAKILLHPSSYEGFGTVCIEALYAGAHVISFVRPMYKEIKHWHIVKTVAEMQAKALELLNAPTNYEPVLAYSANDSADAFMKLFGYTS